MQIYFDTNQLPALTFCGPQPKPNDAMGLSKHYHLSFDPKLGHVICEICRISCDCVACTSMIYQPWIYGVTFNKKPRYQYVTNFNYWPVLGSHNNWNIIQLSPKSTHFEDFEYIHEFFLDRISDNTASLVQYDKYDSINIDYTKKKDVMLLSSSQKHILYKNI